MLRQGLEGVRLSYQCEDGHILIFVQKSSLKLLILVVHNRVTTVVVLFLDLHGKQWYQAQTDVRKEPRAGYVLVDGTLRSILEHVGQQRRRNLLDVSAQYCNYKTSGDC